MQLFGKLIQPEIGILAVALFLKFAGCDQFPQSAFKGTKRNVVSEDNSKNAVVE